MFFQSTWKNIFLLRYNKNAHILKQSLNPLIMNTINRQTLLHVIAIKNNENNFTENRKSSFESVVFVIVVTLFHLNK